jgi:hypothetical protein
LIGAAKILDHGLKKKMPRFSGLTCSAATNASKHAQRVHLGNENKVAVVLRKLLRAAAPCGITTTFQAIGPKRKAVPDWLNTIRAGLRVLSYGS